MVNTMRLREALEEILELAEECEDVEDRPNGSGVRPNRWMEVAMRCRGALFALEQVDAASR